VPSCNFSDEKSPKILATDMNEEILRVQTYALLDPGAPGLFVTKYT